MQKLLLPGFKNLIIKKYISILKPEQWTKDTFLYKNNFKLYSTIQIVWRPYKPLNTMIKLAQKQRITFFILYV